MILYQTQSRLFYISHADNELLQMVAEGGLLLGLPVALILMAGVRLMAKRLREDRTAIFWLRVGASAGMLALFTQNTVEMTLRVPANAVLFAILAAIAMAAPRMEDTEFHAIAATTATPGPRLGDDTMAVSSHDDK